MCGGQNSPPDIHVLVPGSHEHVALRGKGDLANVIKVNHPEVGRLSRTQPRRESFEAENLPQLRSEPKGEVTKRKDRRAATSLALGTGGGPGFLCPLQRTALGEIHVRLEKSPFTKTSSSHVIYKDKSSIFFLRKKS